MFELFGAHFGGDPEGPGALVQVRFNVPWGDRSDNYKMILTRSQSMPILFWFLIGISQSFFS